MIEERKRSWTILPTNYPVIDETYGAVRRGTVTHTQRPNFEIESQLIGSHIVAMVAS